MNDPTNITALKTSVELVARGAALRRQLAAALPVPDSSRDTGATLVVDTGALELDADEIAKPLSDLVGEPHD